MRLRPISIKRALPFVERVHRRLPYLQGALWGVAVNDGDALVGVAVVAWAARMLNKTETTLCVARVAVKDGHPNACSMLYGACSKAAKAMGADNLVTYTHLDELGASLKAANWIEGGVTSGGEHDRPSRPRAAAVDPAPKRRWWAPWSLRARDVGGLR